MDLQIGGHVRVPRLAYHAAVCALPRDMLEEIYCAFVAREAAAIRRWDDASIVEKIQAVSMKIDGHIQLGPTEVEERVIAESSVVPEKRIPKRRKQVSAKCIELGVSTAEIQTDMLRMADELVHAGSCDVYN